MSFKETLLYGKPKNLYDIIDLDNDIKYANDYHFLQSPIYTMGISYIYFNPQ